MTRIVLQLHLTRHSLRHQRHRQVLHRHQPTLGRSVRARTGRAKRTLAARAVDQPALLRCCCCCCGTDRQTDGWTLSVCLSVFLTTRTKPYAFCHGRGPRSTYGQTSERCLTLSAMDAAHVVRTDRHQNNALRFLPWTRPT